MVSNKTLREVQNGAFLYGAARVLLKRTALLPILFGTCGRRRAMKFNDCMIPMSSHVKGQCRSFGSPMQERQIKRGAGRVIFAIGLLINSIRRRITTENSGIKMDRLTKCDVGRIGRAWLFAGMDDLARIWRVFVMRATWVKEIFLAKGPNRLLYTTANPIP